MVYRMTAGESVDLRGDGAAVDVRQATIIMWDPKQDVVISGERGLAWLLAKVRDAWASGGNLVVNAPGGVIRFEADAKEPQA